MSTPEKYFTDEKRKLWDQLNAPHIVDLQLSTSTQTYLYHAYHTFQAFWADPVASHETKILIGEFYHGIGLSGLEGMYLSVHGENDKNWSIVCAQTPSLLQESQYPAFLKAHLQDSGVSFMFTQREQTDTPQLTVSFQDIVESTPHRKTEQNIAERMMTLPKDQQIILATMILHTTVRTLKDIAIQQGYRKLQSVYLDSAETKKSYVTMTLSDQQAKACQRAPGSIAVVRPFNRDEPFEQNRLYLVSKDSLDADPELKYVRIWLNNVYVRGVRPGDPEEILLVSRIFIHGSIVSITDPV